MRDADPGPADAPGPPDPLDLQLARDPLARDPLARDPLDREQLGREPLAREPLERLSGPPDGGGVGDDPLDGGADAAWATDVTAGDGSDDGPSPGGTDARGWFVIGLVLFLVFLGLLVFSVLQPLL